MFIEIRIEDTQLIGFDLISFLGMLCFTGKIQLSKDHGMKAKVYCDGKFIGKLIDPEDE